MVIGIRLVYFMLVMACLGVLLSCYLLINLKVSEKYETDTAMIELSDLSDSKKAEQLQRIELREQEIHQDITLVKIFLLLSCVLTLLFSLYLLFIRRKGINRKG